MKKPKYDAIGYWSEIKLDIIRKYASAYSRIMDRQRSIKKHVYIDAFAGLGQHISRTTGDFVDGSPLNALLVQPPFSEFHLIDVDGNKTDELRGIIGSRSDVSIYDEDANQVLLKKVFPRCLYQDFHRALCLLDPYALTVDWKVIERAGKMGSVEIFFNFMIMDVNMSDLIRLRAFKYVPVPLPMRNDKGAVVYYFYFASPSETGARIVSDIFKKYRDRGIS